MDYTSEPYNFKDEFKFDKSTSSDGNSEYSFTLNQEDLNSFNSIQSQLADKIKKDYAISSNSDKKDEFVVKQAEEPKKDEAKKEDNSDNKTIIFMGSIIIVLLLIIIGYFILNRKKNKEEAKIIDNQNTYTKEEVKPKKEREIDNEIIQDDYKSSSTKSVVKKRK